ncbi:MAG: type II secretion system protein [Kiritimatiellae bacterium]|nr:type II secretion system protein [Kiritimatiellia bacterium]
MNRILNNRAFTLVELMIVIAIIGGLMVALITPISNAAEAARGARCKNNLRNLAQAALNYASAGKYHHLPCAGSYDYAVPDLKRKVMYREQGAWVGWTGRPKGDQISPGSGAKTANCFAESQKMSVHDPAFQSISNGVLYSLVGGDIKVYGCDAHKKVCKEFGKTALRSYVMNPYFGWARSGNNKPNSERRVSLTALSRHGDASKLLLFAEMPCYKPGSRETDVKTSESASDGVLQTKIVDSLYSTSSGSEEYIGFNHTSGRRNSGHVAFADGHVDAVVEPTTATEKDLQDITRAFCNGLEIEQRLQKRMR